MPSLRKNLNQSEADPGQPLYQQIANRLEAAIRKKAFRIGHRMPSVRQLAREQRVSIPTALQAYATLELRGWVDARPKSGFYVRVPTSERIPEIATDLTATKVSDLAATDLWDLIRNDDYDPRKVQLGAAVPCPDLLPGPRLARILSSLARQLGAKGANYGPLEGPLPPAPGDCAAIAHRGIESRPGGPLHHPGCNGGDCLGPEGGLLAR